MAETFYRLEAGRWGLLRKSLPLRQRRRRTRHWLHYEQENLRERYRDRLVDEGRLTSLTAERSADLDGLLDGVSKYLAGPGAHLNPFANAEDSRRVREGS